MMPAFASEALLSRGESPPIEIVRSSAGFCRQIAASSSMTFWVRSSDAPSGSWTITMA